MNAIPCLTIEDVANLDGVLSNFLNKAEAELTVVIDRGGNVISQFGDMNVMDVTIIAALALYQASAEKFICPFCGNCCRKVVDDVSVVPAVRF